MITMKTIFESFEKECLDVAKIHAMKVVEKHLCRACGVESIDGIRSDQLWDIERTFKKYLKRPEVNLSKKSQREYRHRLRTLMEHARKKGFYSQTEPEISNEWKRIAVEAQEKTHHVGYWGIVKVGKFAAGCGYELKDCDEKFFQSYFQYLCSSEGGVEKPRMAYSRTKVALMKLFPEEFPEDRFYKLPSKVNSSYRIPVSEWNDTLSKDIEVYRTWHTAPYVKGRPKKCKQKKETNEDNIVRLERYVGYLRNFLNIPIEDMDWDVLLSYQNVHSFIDYLDKENKPNGAHQKKYLALFRTIACNFLPLGLNKECKDKEAIVEIHEDYIDIPRFRPEDFADRYEEVVMIAGEIKKQRQQYEAQNEKAKKKGQVAIEERTIAFLCMQELLVRLALKRPFRARNFSQMCLDENLVPKNGELRLRFENEAIKTGKFIEYVEFPFPDSLIPLLGEYLKKWRPLLQGGRDIKNVFMSREGTIFGRGQIRLVFLKWSERVHGKHLTTHHIRHISATGFLKRHPGNFLTLQKMLMHRRIETTIRIYSQYNETHASKDFDAFSDQVDIEVKQRSHETVGRKRSKKEKETISEAMQLVLEHSRRSDCHDLNDERE